MLKPETGSSFGKCGEINFLGEQLFCDREGGLFWPRKSMLIVSDLHLEKGAALAARGQMLPPYDTAATLSRLKKCIDFWQPEKIISLGDSFHRDDSAMKLPALFQQQIIKLTEQYHWVWIAGNHDPSAPVDLGGNSVEALREGPFHFVHEQKDQCGGEISGHLHPVAIVRQRGKKLRRRCFAVDQNRMILPAFGAFTGGLNILSDPFNGLFDCDDLRVWMMGSAGVYKMGVQQLCR